MSGYMTDQYLVTIEVPDDADPADLPSPDLLASLVYQGVPCINTIQAVEVRDMTSPLLEAVNNLRMARENVQRMWDALHAHSDTLANALADIDQAIRFIEGTEVPA